MSEPRFTSAAHEAIAETGGKLRIQYHDMSFTADRGHLDRFMWTP